LNCENNLPAPGQLGERASLGSARGLGYWGLGYWELGYWELGYWELGYWELGYWELD